jgi:hypothetical protein
MSSTVRHRSGGRPRLHPTPGDRYQLPSRRTVVVLAVDPSDATALCAYAYRRDVGEEVEFAAKFLQEQCKLATCVRVTPRKDVAEAAHA